MEAVKAMNDNATSDPAMPATTDPTLDRLLRHMAWANATLLGELARLPGEALVLASPRNEWTVAMIVAHIVDAAAWYASLLDGSVCPPDVAVPRTSADIVAIAEACAAADDRLRAVAALPDGMVEKVPGRYNRRSTILGQSIHHATEHRAQVAGALSTNGIAAIDLDALDVWAYGEAEGLGA